ncbi:MAG: glycosyltransferase, partial [Quisquiliibacterium sp.]
GQSRCLKIPIPVAPKSEREIIAGWECMSGTPVVSVCCATYNHVDYVADAICGFLSQKTNFRFEIILRDDASSDGTTDVVLDYAKRYPNIMQLLDTAIWPCGACWVNMEKVIIIKKFSLLCIVSILAVFIR